MKVKRVMSMFLVLCMVFAWFPKMARAESAPDITPDTEMSVTISTGGGCAYLYFTPEYSENYTFYSTGTADTYGYLYDADMNELSHDDDGGDGSNFSITISLEAGVTYIFGAKYYSSSKTGSIAVYLQTNHAYQEKIIVPSTCTEEGQMEYTCDICKYSYIGTIDPAHSWSEDKVCSVCGTEWYVDGTCGDNLNWDLSADGVLTISGSGPMTNFDGAGYVPWYSYADEIMEIHIGDEVTSIGAFAFYECANVSNVIIPDSIGLISSYAFSYCEGLNKITIPDSVYQIAWGAFSQCTNLTSITVVGTNCDISWESGTLGVPGTTVVHGYEKSSAYYAAINNGYTFTAHEYENGVCTSCGVSRMLSGTANETIEWSLDTVTGELSISGTGNILVTPWSAYETLVKYVDIGDGITGIPEAAFFYFEELVSVRFGSGFTAIPSSSFFGCEKLESVELPDTIKEIGTSAFHQCHSLRNINIPAGLETINDGAFDSCTGLTSVCFPDCLKSIYSGAFKGCTSLGEITFGKLNRPYISSDAFTDVIATVYYPEANATWPDGALTDYGGTLTWEAYEVDAVEGVCGDNITWVFDDGILTVTGTGLMYDYWDGVKYDAVTPWREYTEQIVAINMSDGILNVGAGAFFWCYNLSTLKLSGDITVIGSHAFCGLPFENMVIPEGTVEIGSKAFTGTHFNSITFPSTLKIVGESAFEWSGVQNVYVPSMEVWCGIEFDSVFANPFAETWSNNLYVNGELVTDVVIPYGVTKIGVAQFAGYSSLTSIQIPDSVTHVDDKAFDMTPNGYGSKSKLTEIVFPASVEYIGERALGFNDNLQRIVILNPDCEIACTTIDDEGYYHEGMYVTWSENTPVIYGCSGSTAEAYASSQGFEFVALEKYEIISGANSTVKIGENLTIRANGDFSKFEGVAVDGLMIDPANYTVSEGSTIVTFTAEYLSTLENREHTVTVFFADGVASTTLTILAYVPGDINGDGAVNNKDVTRLFQYLSDWDVNVNEAALDVNGDGAVNNKDLTRLFQYLSDWNVEIH